MSADRTWHALIAVDDLIPNDVTIVHHHQMVLAVYDGIEHISVSSARCTHAGANLCDGYFDGKTIECPLHQGLFDVVTGEARAAPATKITIEIDRVLAVMLSSKAVLTNPFYGCQ